MGWGSVRRAARAHRGRWREGRVVLADISSDSHSSSLLLYVRSAFRPSFSTTTSLLLFTRLRGALSSDTTLSIPPITRIPSCLPNTRSPSTPRCITLASIHIHGLTLASWLWKSTPRLSLILVAFYTLILPPIPLTLLRATTSFAAQAPTPRFSSPMDSLTIRGRLRLTMKPFKSWL